jgi:hypothetical protein
MENGKKISRRKALKRVAVGSALLAASGTTTLVPMLSKREASGASADLTQGIESADAYQSLAYLGLNATATPTRDSSGDIIGITYGPASDGSTLSVTVNRNPDGTIASIVNSISPGNLTETLTVNRNPDGTVASLVWSGNGS